ncbi:MAG: replicative DNA helicase [Firmicutes bacterium]|nr:replicative DNA helicase [Bacillota bacterium]
MADSDNQNIYGGESSPEGIIEEKQIPYSKEAEQAVIGSAITKSECVAEIADVITPDDFYFYANKEIFTAIMDLFDSNIMVDFVSVSDKLAQKNKLDAVGGVEYLRSLIDVPTTYNVVYYSDIIKEKSLRRRLIANTNIIKEKAYGDGSDMDNVLQSAEELIYEVAAEDSSDLLPISDILLGSYQQLIEDASKPGGLTGLSTGYTQLNKRTGGFHGGELLIIAGRPGMGKSSFAVNIAEHVSINDNKPVAIFNLEMPKEQIVNRIICSQAYVDSNSINTGTLKAEDWERIGDVINSIAKAPLYIDDTPSMTPAKIKAKCIRLKQTRGLELVVVDYLQLMQSGGKHDSRQQEISEISRSLKILAKELDVPVIALSQLSRATETRSDKRPMLSDLRESGAIEQDADMVMFLYRESYQKTEEAESRPDNEIAKCIIAKNRSGSVGDFDLSWCGKYTKYSNLQYRSEDE